jgi:muconolactone D-isomerase
MLFMVNIEVSVPADLPQKDKDDLRRRETDRAIELIKANKLRRIWRIVGQVANFSVWEADSLEELHANIGSLGPRRMERCRRSEHPLDSCLSMIFFRKPVPTFRDHALPKGGLP